MLTKCSIERVQFEKLLRHALSDIVGGKINYFSLLRSVSELWIARHFATQTQLAWSQMASCNRNFVFAGEISNHAYQPKKEGIKILFDNGKVKEIIKASDHLNLKVLSKPVTKYYICYPKQKL